MASENGNKSSTSVAARTGRGAHSVDPPGMSPAAQDHTSALEDLTAGEPRTLTDRTESFKKRATIIFTHQTPLIRPTVQAAEACIAGWAAVNGSSGRRCGCRRFLE